MLWRLAIVGFPFIVLLLIPGLMYGRSLISITRKIREEYKEAGSIAEQAISLVRTVYAFGSETKLIAKFSAALEGSMKLGVTVRKRRLIEVADDEDDSDVEITPPPTQATTLRKQSTCGTGQALKSKKPMIQSTLDGGIGSSSTATKRKTKTKSIHFTIRGGRKSSRLTQSNGKKNKKIQEEQLDSEGEFEEDEMEKEMENEKEGRQWSDVWPHFTKIRNSNGEEKAKCNYCKNDYAWSSHGHGTSG
ncbi:unnamed protein product, partial [Brassica oleracea var. botrytis]